MYICVLILFREYINVYKYKSVCLCIYIYEYAQNMDNFYKKKNIDFVKKKKKAKGNFTIQKLKSIECRKVLWTWTLRFKLTSCIF